MNFILDTDSYKLSHFLGYPPELTHVYSYAESRGGKYDATVMAGITKFVTNLAKVKVSGENVREAEIYATEHGEPFNRNGWYKIVDIYDGRIPVRIKAVPEGLVVPTRNVLVTVENTDPTMPWLTSYIETALLRDIWYPITVATRVHEMKKKIKPYYDRTSDTGNMDFALLDFSARGCSSRETAEVGGMAHLMSFMGSDNIPAVLAARRYYGEHMAAYSVPATEHSVTTAWGGERELESIEYIIENMMPENGILSMVADTWNVYEFIKKAARFKDRIRAKNGTLVIRPDSGEMREVLPKVMMLMGEHFGRVENDKGYDLFLDSKVLQGDGVNEETVVEPFQIGQALGISADSIMTGSGGGLMQANIDRDTCKFAFKASNVTSNGVDRGVAKDPITDPGKRSKRGRLALVEDNWFLGRYETIPGPDPADQLRTVYENGKVSNLEDFSVIRQRLQSFL